MATTEVTEVVSREEYIDKRVRERGEQLATLLSRYLAIAAVVWTVALGIGGLVLLQYPQILASAVLFPFIAVSGWTFPRFHNQGRSKTGINFLLATILIVSACMSFFIPEILPISLIGYTLTVLVSYLLLGSKDCRWFGVACIAAFIIDVILVNLWRPVWFTPLSGKAIPIVTSAISAITLISAVVVVGWVMTGQEKSFRQLQEANLQIEEYAEGERGQHEYVQSKVQEYVKFMSKVGQGNLAIRLPVNGNGRAAQDPLTALGHSLNQMAVSLQGMILQIRDASTNLSSATTEILAATTQQASGANEQSAAITQTTTTVDQVKVIAEQLVERGQEVVDISQRTVKVSLAGKNTVQETIGGMNRIRERVESIAKNIIALSERTLQIREIIATVDDIAAQSNMLALNASVEAAHAGEHGKGFAAVAVEVRNLARQSQQATTQVRAILSQVQKGIGDAATTTEGSTKVVEEGMQLAVQTQETIGQLAAVIDESAQMAMQMVAGGRQQASGVEQIAVAMQSINQATAQNLSSTRQTEDAAQNLNSLARSLTETVEQYQL